jgi:lipopolysaccharide transport system ATP-binding protein
MSSELAIKVEKLSKCYHIYEKPHDRLLQMFARGSKQFFREFWAVRELSFEIKRGETVGIVGRNGSGKSTLLQMICSTLNPTAGNIVTTGRIAALLELGSGFNPEFTGRENVYLNAQVLGLSKEETDDRFDDILAFAEIGEFIEQPVKTYSSGMMVRLAFAVQAMVDPEILIVDEALAVGDEKFQRKCFARLEELKSKGTSILFVSHSGPQVIELCDRALLMERGQLIMISSPQHVIRSYQRLIYAPESEQSLLLEEFSKEQVKFIAKDELRPKEQIVLSNESVDSFDPGLMPETTTSYPELGARIETIEIHDADGNIVNVITPMQRYRIVMTGVLTAVFDRIYFGIHFRSVSGAVISGQRYPEEGCYVESPEKGKKFRVDFWFDMNLFPGSYFIGGGVWSPVDGVCAHRIMDASMFRVQSKGILNSFGYCDLVAAPAEFRMD